MWGWTCLLGPGVLARAAQMGLPKIHMGGFAFCSRVDRSDFSDVCFLLLDRYRSKWDVGASDARSKVLQRDVQELWARSFGCHGFSTRAFASRAVGWGDKCLRSCPYTSVVLCVGLKRLPSRRDDVARTNNTHDDNFLAPFFSRRYRRSAAGWQLHRRNHRYHARQSVLHCLSARFHLDHVAGRRGSRTSKASDFHRSVGARGSSEAGCTDLDGIQSEPALREEEPNLTVMATGHSLCR